MKKSQFLTEWSNKANLYRILDLPNWIFFHMAEEIFDQRYFTFLGNSEQGVFTLDEMIRQCGYFSSAEVCTYLNNGLRLEFAQTCLQ